MRPTRLKIAAFALAFLLPVSVIFAQDQNINIQNNAGDNTGNESSNNSSGTTDFPNVELGFRFMPTFTDFDLHDAGGGKVEGEFTFGYGFGGVVGINFGEHIGAQGEVIYSSLAQKYRDNDLDHTVKLRYLNIPLLLSINSGKSRIVNLNVVVGPQIGINVGSDIETVEGGDEVAILAVKKGDLGVAYGAGLQFGHKVKFDVGFRGVYGLIDISDDSGTTTTNEYYILDRTHVKTYSVYAGISFLL